MTCNYYTIISFTLEIITFDKIIIFSAMFFNLIKIIIKRYGCKVYILFFSKLNFDVQNKSLHHSSSYKGLEQLTDTIFFILIQHLLDSLFNKITTGTHHRFFEHLLKNGI